MLTQIISKGDKMNGLKIRIFSVIAVLAMITCAFIPIANGYPADNDQEDASHSIVSSGALPTYRYVSLGDSMTTGFGMAYDGMIDGEMTYEKGYYTVIDDKGNLKNSRGFLKEVTGTYPSYMTEYLKDTLNGRFNVEHVQLGISAARSVDIRAMLYGDDFLGSDYFPGDGYTLDKFINTNEYIWAYTNAIKGYPALAADRGFVSDPTSFTLEDKINAFYLLGDIYRQEINEADLITYNSHYNFGRILGEIPDLIAGGSTWDEFDYSLYFDESFIKMAEGAEELVAKYLAGCIVYLLPDLNKDEIMGYLQMVNNISRIIAYSVVSYCSDYDAIMGYIDKNNVYGANVIVIDTYDQFNDISLDILGAKISVTGLYDHLLDIVNTYVNSISEYNGKCDNISIYHVTADDHTELFGDEFRAGAPSAVSKASLMYAMDSGLYRPTTVAKYNESIAAYDYLDRNGYLTDFMTAVFSTDTLDLIDLINSDIGGLGEKVKGMSDLLFGGETCEIVYEPNVSFTIKSESATYTFSNAELFLLYFELAAVNGDAVLAHINADGHKAIFENIRGVVSDKGILPAAE